ncbi:hypothetical protein SAY87_017153 [Trapa incisa]|uniref:rhamnogalacturonan endolyase n=1 Tax=Trapa incisa TaxID=236973 RepID=A0AAN7L787_9MYRT|nr:hypothetical protein SAY87_017153 [Trapa incisa]
MAISDDRQRFMPTESDRASGKPLAYPEAVLLTSPSNPQLRGEVDDKYQYSSENQDYNLHGWISKDPVVGFWIISPSNEFRTGGPVKQQLTCHVGPTALNMFISAHYAGREIAMEFAHGEPWKKVFGPFLVYLNSNPPQGLYSELWQDASRQMLIEGRSWPYNFATSDDFPASSQRGTVTGQLLIRDRYVNDNDIPAGTAYVGLAAPGDVGSWQTESKGYQFWTRAYSSGYFTIENVRAGIYNLYSWVPGTLGDYKHYDNVIVAPGTCLAQLGSLVYEPPRSGPTIWEIGIPDSAAAEFYVPDPSPTADKQALKFHLSSIFSSCRFRQYGLWERYSELYPREDLVFTVGTSNFRKDWFFAHVTRIYTLQLALAAASISQIQVRFNDPSTEKMPLFTTTLIGSDDAIARHGIHGLYHLYSISVPGASLRAGSNALSLTQSRAEMPFQGVMYD